MQQQNNHAQASPAVHPGAPRQTAIPHNQEAFMYYLQLWLVQTGRNVDAIPKIGDKPLDLHQLYIEVETLGGPEKVQAMGLWRLVAVKMGCVTHEQNDPQLVQIAKALADTYATLLVPFDDFCLDRMRGVGTVNGIQGNQLGQMGDGVNPDANLERVLEFLQVTLKDWMPDSPPQTKLLRASQMYVAQMQREGWSAERIAIVQRFRPALMQFRAAYLQQTDEQAVSQLGMQLSEINILDGAGGGAGASGSAQSRSLDQPPMKAELKSVTPIELEHATNDPLESMEQALAGLQNVAPGPNGDGIDPDILAQLSEILDGAGGAAGASGSAQPPSLDQPPDASGPKVEDVFDFSYYLNDTLGDEDMFDAVADDTGAGEGWGRGLAGSRAPTLTGGFWEAFNDGEMAEGAYYAGGGASSFSWNGPIEPNLRPGSGLRAARAA